MTHEAEAQAESGSGAPKVGPRGKIGDPAPWTAGDAALFDDDEAPACQRCDGILVIRQVVVEYPAFSGDMWHVDKQICRDGMWRDVDGDDGPPS